jgi:hypothetical protein
MTSAEIHGTVFGLDASGKTLWTRPMENQMLRLSQPSQLPVATFLNEVYEQVNRTTRRYYELVCVDRRDGAELHKLSEQNKSNQQYELVADPDKHTLQIRSQVGAVDFKFSGK